MKKQITIKQSGLTILCIAALAMGTIFSGCSSDKKAEEKKPDKVQQITDKLGADAARQIQVPIERAQQVQGVEDQYNDQLKEAAQ